MLRDLTLRVKIFYCAIFLAGVGCQNPPTVAGSARPNSLDNAPPMESRTTNAELEKRKKALELLLAGKVSELEFEKAKEFNDKLGKGSDENLLRLSQVIGVLELENLPKHLNNEQKDFALGQFYFYERRFIESSIIFSRLLDSKPGWLRVRNLLARCFYFLGNLDRAFLELQYVIQNHANQKEELLDSLFLIGAIAMDSPVATKEQTEKGVGAWQTYLKLAPDSPLRSKIEDGLAAFALRSQKSLAAHPEKGDKKSNALAAVESDDLLTAETKIRAAQKESPHDEELGVALARTFVKSGRVKESLAEFKRVIRDHPKSVTAHHYQGMAFMMAGDPEKAIASWETVLRLDPAYGERYGLRGRILIARNISKKEGT